MGAVKKEVGIDRGPSPHNTKHVISCPICKTFKLTLTKEKIKGNDLSSQFGVPTESWKLDGSEFNGQTDWRAVLRTHIRGHSVDEFVERVFELENEVACWHATADDYSDFLREFAEATKNMTVVQIKSWIDTVRKGSHYVHLPAELKDY